MDPYGYAVGSQILRFPMTLRRLVAFLFFLSLLAWPLLGRAQSTGKNQPHVVVVGVNGKLRTLNAPNCPRVYSTMFTSTRPEEHGVTGFLVGGITANTNMLKQEPIWSVLSKNGITVGMANVPATFPVMSVNGYMISGMLTRGKNCEDGVLCAPKLSEVEGGDAVYPPAMKAELLKNVGDFYIDCERMPAAADLKGHESEFIGSWLNKVQLIRDEQTKLFDYLLDHHP